MTGGKKGSEQINVVVRCRPMTLSEKSRTRKVIECNHPKKNELSVTTGSSSSGLGSVRHSKTYNFDKVFGEKSKQIDVYNDLVAGQLNDVLSGYNCTVLAYGQTGTGKTFTMEGEQSQDTNYKWDEDPKSGIIPRALSHLFDLLTNMDVEFSVRISLLEIYNEEIYDLLSPSSDLPKLRIFDDASRKGSVVVSNLTELCIREKEQVYEILQRGSNKRRTAATNMNEFSSRSHSVFSVTVHTKDTTQNNMESEELVKIGKLNLVDLAGSENIGRSGAVDKRAREAGNINTSLLTLGRCITALVDKAPHVPYRESKLTRLLQDSLGGTTKTSIIATISPGQNNLEESLSTLDYAFRSKSIHNRPKVNQKLTKKALIQEYDKEINRLRRDLEAAREKSGVYLPHDKYEEMVQSIESNELTMKARLEELESYKAMFQTKENELHQRSEQLTNTLSDLENYKNRVKEMRTKTKTLAKYSTDVYEQASQLNETVSVAKQDISKIHEKVDRVTNVNESNISNVKNLFSRLSTDIKESQNQSVEIMEQIQNKTKLNIEGYDNLKSSTTNCKEDIENLHKKLQVVLLKLQENIAFTSEVNNQNSECYSSIQDKLDQMEKSVSGMNWSNKIETDLNINVEKNCNMLKEQQEISLQTNKLVEDIKQKCEVSNQKLSEVAQSNVKNYENLYNVEKEHVNIDEEFKATQQTDMNTLFDKFTTKLQQEKAKMQQTIAAKEAEFKTIIEEMKCQMQDSMNNMSEFVETMKNSTIESQQSTFKMLDDRKSQLRSTASQCITFLKENNDNVEKENLADMQNVACVCNEHLHLVNDKNQQAELSLLNMTSQCDELVKSVKRDEEQTKQLISGDVMKIKNKYSNFHDKLLLQEQKNVENSQAVQSQMNVEISHAEQIIDKCGKIFVDLSGEQQMAEENIEKISQLKEFSSQNCNEIRSNASNYAESLRKPNITGETPAKGRVYKNVRKIEEIPEFALEGLDETIIEVEDEKCEENQQDETSESILSNQENNSVMETSEDSICIPDKGGIPFFKHKTSTNKKIFQRSVKTPKIYTPDETISKKIKRVPTDQIISQPLTPSKRHNN